MPWRTEPEIDEQRQGYIAQRRAIIPDEERGIYPFRDERGSIRLTRADVEWLLATHVGEEGLQGPVDWADPRQRTRLGVDFRGADLGGLNLNSLPLTNAILGLNKRHALGEDRKMAA